MHGGGTVLQHQHYMCAHSLIIERYCTLETGIWKAGSSGVTAVVELKSAVLPLLLRELALTADSSAVSGVTDACNKHNSLKEQASQQPSDAKHNTNNMLSHSRAHGNGRPVWTNLDSCSSLPICLHNVTLSRLSGIEMGAVGGLKHSG